MVTHGLQSWPQQRPRAGMTLKFHPYYNGMRNSRKYQTLRASYPASILNYVMFVIRISLHFNRIFSILSKYIILYSEKRRENVLYQKIDEKRRKRKEIKLFINVINTKGDFKFTEIQTLLIIMGETRPFYQLVEKRVDFAACPGNNTIQYIKNI